MAAKYETPRDGVVQITLSRPDKLNAFDGQLRHDFRDALADASADKSVRAVVVTGEGRGFCAGADLSAVQEKMNVEDVLNTEYASFLNIIYSMPKPVIAAINGPAAGIGMTTALVCDLKVMGESAYVMSAFANISLVPDGGLSYLLTQQIGYSRAYQVAIEAEKIGAEKALEWGLVNRVVKDDAVLEDALDWAESIVERAPLAMEFTKRAFRAACMEGYRNAASFEAMLQRTALQSEDCREGVTALFEKRKPNFVGQ